jgi:hypothetical protein
MIGSISNLQSLLRRFQPQKHQILRGFRGLALQVAQFAAADGVGDALVAIEQAQGYPTGIGHVGKRSFVFAPPAWSAPIEWPTIPS